MDEDNIRGHVSMLVNAMKTHNDENAVRSSEQLLSLFLINQQRIADSLDKLAGVVSANGDGSEPRFNIHNR